MNSRPNTECIGNIGEDNGKAGDYVTVNSRIYIKPNYPI
jgi:hypothetical protein